MTHDAFPRFVLLVGCTVYAIALEVVAITLGSWLAFGGFVAGVVGAMILSTELEPSKPKPVKTVVGVPPEGLSRLDIARRARAAGDEDDE